MADYYRYNQRTNVSVAPNSKDFAQCGFVVYIYGREKNFNLISAYGALLDQYSITVAPGEVALLELDKTTSVNNFSLNISATTNSLTPQEAVKKSTDTGFSDIITADDGTTYRVLSNNSTKNQTYYVAIGTNLRQYKISIANAQKALNLVNQIKSIPWNSLLNNAVTLPENTDMVKWACQRNPTVNNMVNNAKSILKENPLVTYKLNISRLNDEEAPIFATAPEITSKGASATIKCMAHDNFLLAGYEVSIFSSDDRLVARTESEFSTIFLNSLAPGDYRAEITAFDYLKRNKTTKSSDFSVAEGKETDFKSGFSGSITNGNRFVEIGNFSLNFEQVFFWNDIMSSNQNGEFSARIVDSKNRVKAKIDYNRGRMINPADFKLAAGDYSVMLKSNVSSQYTIAVESLDILASPENNQISTASEIAFIGGGATLTGYVGYGNSIDYYHLNLNCNGALTVNTENLRSKVKFELYNANKKKIAAKTLGSEGVVFSNSLIAQGAYMAVISNDKGKGKYNSNYQLNFTTEVFPDSEGDSLDLPQGELTFGGEQKNGWVGFGDQSDFYRLDFNAPGNYKLDVSGAIQKLQLTIYTLSANNTYRKFKSTQVSTKTGSATLNNLLLKPDTTYVVMVNNPHANKGKNSNYSLSFNGTSFNNPNNDLKNNRWDDEEVGIIDLNTGISNEWVGFGDAVDYFNFELSESNGCSFFLNAENPKAVKLTLYAVDDVKNKLNKIKLNKYGYADLASGNYVIELFSADKGKGKSNTKYDLSIALQS